MKRFSYTQMRSELSDVLEVLRSGESIQITQRGKPDVIICCLSNTDQDSSLQVSKLNNNGLNETRSFHITSEMKEVMEHMNKTIKDLNVFQSPESQRMLKQASGIAKNLGLSNDFVKSILLIQERHANTIKKLADK